MNGLAIVTGRLFIKSTHKTVEGERLFNNLTNKMQIG